MINELIEKYIEKFYWDIMNRGVNKDDIRNSLQTITKEVAMVFKKDVWDPKTEYDKGYVLGLIESNNIADQIINEVSGKL